MIVPDVNLLLHAYNRDSPRHGMAKGWWTQIMNGDEAVGLPWVTILGFIRIGGHPGILAHPLPAATLCGHARSWLAQPAVSILEPGPRHAEVLFSLLEGLGVSGNLTTDAHLAALAIEHQAELYSSDADFSRFPGLRWRNPLARRDH